MATAAQLATIHSWIGTDTIIPADVDQRLARLGSAEAVSLELLRQRRADLLLSPTRIQVDGDVTVDWSDTIRGLDRAITSLEDIVGSRTGPRHVSMSSFGRPSTRARRFYRY
jgi:hypothetical protein